MYIKYIFYVIICVSPGHYIHVKNEDKILSFLVFLLN